MSTDGSSRPFTAASALAGAWPADWKWCGGCGGPTRRLTEVEAQRALLVIAGAALTANLGGLSALDVLDALAWPLEIHGRSDSVVCAHTSGCET